MYELIPQNGRKSFYGKAKILIEGNWNILYSYNTPIIKKNIKTRALVRLYDYEPSNTTCCHIKSFCGLNKASFMKMGVAK